MGCDGFGFSYYAVEWVWPRDAVRGGGGGRAKFSRVFMDPGLEKNVRKFISLIAL